jgi:hypothetical protein
VLLVGVSLHLGIARHLVGRDDVPLALTVVAIALHHGLDVGTFLRQRAIPVQVLDRVLGRKRRVELG